MKGVHFICAVCQLPVKHRARDKHNCRGLAELRARMSVNSGTNPARVTGPRPQQLALPEMEAR